MTFKYPSSDRNIDDKIVSEALGSERVVIDSTEAVSEPQPAKAGGKRKSKTRKALAALGVGAVLLVGAGMYASNGQAPKLSPELAHLLATGKTDAPPPEAAAPSIPVAEPDFVERDEADPGPETMAPAALAVAPAGAASQDSPAVAPAPVSVAAQPEAVAPTPAPAVTAPTPAVAATPPSAPDQALLLSLKKEVEQLKKTVADLEKDKSDLKTQVVALQKAEAKPVVAKPVSKPVQKPKPAPRPVVAKPAIEPVKKVMAILSDGIVLHDGDVIDVGTSSPKVGGKLTGVSPSTGAIEVNGEARHVVVDPN